VSKEVIRDSIDVARQKGNAVAITPINEALLTTSDQKTSSKIIDRDTTKKTQTPHTFPLGTLLDMHRKAKIQGITDTVASCTLAIELGMKVNFSRGSEKNFKVTTPEDIEIFKALLNAQKSNWMK
jgi:2-C-methyl-D-erythritol 4-phosphate cytidylyltransferase